MTQQNEAFFIRDYGTSFGTYSLEDEYLHKSIWPDKPHYALSETQYFSFSVPEHDIHAFLYCWCHPNLRAVSGGAVVFKGTQPLQLGVELYDYRAHMSDAVLSEDLGNFRFDNSYSVQMIEPGRIFRLRYEDRERDNAFDVTLTAQSAPVMWPDNRHFEQVMKTEGFVKLRSQEYAIDGFSMRDRSWGEARMELALPGPSNSWAVGTFDADFAFVAVGTDSPATTPIWSDHYTESMAKPLTFGWMIHNGQRSPVTECRKRIEYDRSTLMCRSVEMELVTASGERFDLKGTATAGTPLPLWPNIRVPVSLIRWECNGRVGWGELQDAQWSDFIFDFAEKG